MQERTGLIKVLLVGYGSIGRRHYRLLTSISAISSVDVVSSQEIASTTVYKDLKNVSQDILMEYDLFIICSETHLHVEHLLHIDSRVQGKLIVIEKPIFHQYIDYTPRNQINVAYNLRFHPIIQDMKRILQRERILTFSTRAGQYLPLWRPDRDYQTSYSADIQKGGGVLRDLSHELDYTMMLCGDLEVEGAISSKVSDLAINSDDICALLCKSSRGIIVSVWLDYLALKVKREVNVQTASKALHADLVAQKLTVTGSDGRTDVYTYEDYSQDSSYASMHHNVLFHGAEDLCKYDEAMKLMTFIQHITEKYMELTQ